MYPLRLVFFCIDENHIPQYRFASFCIRFCAFVDWLHYIFNSNKPRTTTRVNSCLTPNCSFQSNKSVFLFVCYKVTLSCHNYICTHLYVYDLLLYTHNIRCVLSKRGSTTIRICNYYRITALKLVDLSKKSKASGMLVKKVYQFVSV